MKRNTDSTGSIGKQQQGRKVMKKHIIGWWSCQDTYCKKCGDDLPTIDSEQNAKYAIFSSELEELLEGWTRTMSYVGCITCRKGADRWVV